MKRIIFFLSVLLVGLSIYAEAPVSIYLRNTLMFSDNERTPVQLTPIISPAGADNSIIWQSDNPEVATVENGLVVPVGAGTAVITATSASDANIVGRCTVTVLDGDNLVADWDGNEIVGEGSEMDKFGWSCTLNSDTTASSGYIFQPTTGSASNGMRYDPQRKMSDASGKTVYVRTAILRLKSTTTVQYPVELKAGTQYRFKSYVAYGSNGQTYTIDINEKKSSLGTSIGKYTLKTNGSSVKSNTFYPVELVFKAQNSGVHYICFGTANGSTQNGFVVDMSVQKMRASVKLHFVDKEGNVLRPDVTIEDLDAGNRFDVPEEYVADFEQEGKKWYFDLNESFNYIEELQEGENELTLVFSDEPVSPESFVTIYFRDDAGNDLKDPKNIEGLTPGEGFKVSEEDMKAISVDGRVYLFNAEASDTIIESLEQGHDNSLTLRFTETQLNVRSTLMFYKNKMEPQTLTAMFTPEKGQGVYWISDNPETATVEDGKVVPNKPGVALISAVSTDCEELYSNCLVIVKGTDNLIVDWDGGDIVGEGSEPDNFGWLCTLDSDPENGNPGLTFDPTTGTSATAHRYDPNRKMTDDLGEVFYGRTAIIRIKNTTTMNYPVELEAGKSYRFSGRVMYNSSGAKNNIGIYTEKSRKGKCLKTTTIKTETGITNRLQPINMTFTAETSGTHYIAFATENSGTLTAFLVDLCVEEVSASVTIEYVDENWETIKESTVVTGLNPGNSYTATEDQTADFEYNGAYYVFNPNSFVTIDNLQEGNNTIILQFTKTDTSGILDVESENVASKAYFMTNGQYVGNNAECLPDRGVFIVRVTYKDGSVRTGKFLR